jgi:hypothetical protein
MIYFRLFNDILFPSPDIRLFPRISRASNRRAHPSWKWSGHLIACSLISPTTFHDQEKIVAIPMSPLLCISSVEVFKIVSEIGISLGNCTSSFQH